MQTPGPAIQLPGPKADTAAPLTAQAVLRKTKISPKKLNEFAKLVRRLHIDDALVQCQVAPNKAAKLCYKVASPAMLTTFASACCAQLPDGLFPDVTLPLVSW